MAIRVTDVQGLLRHYANMGHDVLSDPRAVHLDGKRYGMAVGHRLDIPHTFFGRRFAHDPANPNVPRTHSLDTYLQQSELPIISHVSTQHVGIDETGPVDTYRSVKARVPHIGDADNSYFGENTKEGRHLSWINKDGLWTPDHTSGHKEVHEALETHTSGDVSHLGKVSLGPSTYRDRAMEPEDLRNFNTKEAFSELLGPHKPFSNVIHVTEHDSADEDGFQHHYTYDPDTEQLLPINK